jgi:hypothetical protein
MTVPLEVAALLLDAYRPCAEFAAACGAMRWSPATGHIPRGFCGALDGCDAVELVLVTAEPGDPHDAESYAQGRTPAEQLAASSDHSFHCLRNGRDLFHRNLRSILDHCYPDLSFEAQMVRVWITDSVKCSARREGGHVPAVVARACRERFLNRELALFPRALVVALGRKAQHRLRGRAGLLAVASVAPPFGATGKAQSTWLAIPAALVARQQR